MPQVGTLSNSLVEICDFIFDKLNSNKANLELQAVFFGDQDRLPTTPVACVEPGTKRRPLRRAGSGRMVDITFELSILVYHSFVASPQENRRGADLLAEAIELLVDSDQTLGGLVIHGYCTEVQSGYANKANNLTRANRIMYEAVSQFILPS